MATRLKIFDKHQSDWDIKNLEHKKFGTSRNWGIRDDVGYEIEGNEIMDGVNVNKGGRCQLRKI